MAVFSYCYATSSPFITSQLFGFSSVEYGLWNTMTIIGIVTGSLIVAKIVNKYSSESNFNHSTSYNDEFAYITGCITACWSCYHLDFLY